MTAGDDAGAGGSVALAIEDRGPPQRDLVRIGQDWFHSVADRKSAIAQIGAGFSDFMLELARWHAANPDLRRAMATAQWVEVDVLPTVAAWNAFAGREKSSWWVRAATRWETFVGWNIRLRRFRELARAHGIVLESPEPPPLPQTLWEQGETGHGNSIAPWFGIAKLAFGGAVMIVGAVGVHALWTSLRRPVGPGDGDGRSFSGFIDRRRHDGDIVGGHGDRSQQRR